LFCLQHFAERNIPYLLTWYRSVGKDNLNEAPIILSNDKSLHLNDANFNTQGIYWVHFESTTGESIRSKPVYLLEWKCENLDLGGDTSGINYEWALLRGGNIIRQYSEDSTLVIKKADPWNDYGVYRCEVEDDDGELIGQAYTAVTIGFTDPSSLI
uniref:Ig-like domain-containing protein n=1 Tax=Brugia pahangi TaxID=6280 RepID=A0A0N4T908_BRUPA